MTRVRPAFLAALALALPACAHLAGEPNVCPEYRDLRCMTAPECSMDRARGCRVCGCSQAGADDIGRLPSGVAPDRRTSP